VVNASVRSVALRRKAQKADEPTGLPGGAKVATADWLKSSEPRHRKVRNGMEDNVAREGRVATDGEKPLKGGFPWTIQSEKWLADLRRVSSRERQTRPAEGVTARLCRRPRERGLEDVAGTRISRVIPTGRASDQG